MAKSIATDRSNRPSQQTVATDREVLELLAKNDFKFWFERILVGDGRRTIERELRKKVLANSFKKLRQQCSWWKNQDRPRRSPSPEALLDAKGWEELRIAVKKVAVDLQGRSIAEAVAIVSTIKRCNERTLRGLNQDLHFWNSNKKSN